MRRMLPRIGSSSPPRWNPITASGRSASTLWIFRTWPWVPWMKPVVSTTIRSAPAARACSTSFIAPMTIGSMCPFGEVEPTK